MQKCEHFFYVQSLNYGAVLQTPYETVSARKIEAGKSLRTRLQRQKEREHKGKAEQKTTIETSARLTKTRVTTIKLER